MRTSRTVFSGMLAGLLSVAIMPGAALADEAATPDAQAPLEAQAVTYENMYRLYNRYSGEHFYTDSLEEIKSLAVTGWNLEGVGWVAPSQSSSPVYRLYNPFSSDHHYTLSAEERDALVGIGWSNEGVGWYSDTTVSKKPLLRQFNPYATIGTHNYTLSAEERDALVAIGWQDEGTAWNASSMPATTITGFWYETSVHTGTTERYWVDNNAALASNRIIRPDEGAGLTGFARPGGALLRNGAYGTGDRVYLADGNGNLVTGAGWLVTDAYAGSQQRYWLETADGVSFAKPGFFTIDGCKYYANPDTGAIYRNCNVTIDGHMYHADDNGVLTEVSVPDGTQAMFDRLGDLSSPTEYGIFINNNEHKVGIFQGGTGNWQLVHAFDCSNGAPWTPTVLGTFTVSDRGYSFGSGYTCYYYTRFYGDYLFHSILYEEGTFIVQDGTMGESVSHGCVRLALENAKWIYDNIPDGTTVISF